MSVILHKIMIKKGIQIKKIGAIHFIIKDGKVQKHKPWLGDLFTFSYDFLMEKNVFPKKLTANMADHLKKNQDVLNGLREKNILELGTGSGSICSMIDPSNHYAGIDVSKGLLNKAGKRLTNMNFQDFSLFLASAEDLPFSDGLFDWIICNLSFNFFNDAQQVVNEIKRVLNRKGQFFCSVPIPERNTKKTQIHGVLRSKEELKSLFQANEFGFTEIPPHNGAIFYFMASKKEVEGTRG